MSIFHSGIHHPQTHTTQHYQTTCRAVDVALADLSDWPWKCTEHVPPCFALSETTVTQLSGSALCSHRASCKRPKDSRIHDCAGDCICHSTTVPAYRRTTVYARCSILLLITLRHISPIPTRSPTHQPTSLFASSGPAMRPAMQSAAHSTSNHPYPSRHAALTLTPPLALAPLAPAHLAGPGERARQSICLLTRS